MLSVSCILLSSWDTFVHPSEPHDSACALSVLGILRVECVPLEKSNGTVIIIGFYLFFMIDFLDYDIYILYIIFGYSRMYVAHMSVFS